MSFLILAILHVTSTSACFQTEEIPAKAVEIVKGLEQESDQIRVKMNGEIALKRQAAIEKLQVIQDNHTRQVKLDDAAAIRDKIRSLKQDVAKPAPPANVKRQPQPALPGMVILRQRNNQHVQVIPVPEEPLPGPAADIIKIFEQESETIRMKWETEIGAKRAIVIRKLQEILDGYAHEAKLDEALTVRDLIRSLKASGLKALPNPRTLTEYRGQVGKVLIFEVTGGHNGTIYGSDIYTDDSDLSTAVVHANVLRAGEKGIVKVTILPGQDAYETTSRNGIASVAYGPYPGSYKIQPLFRGNRASVHQEIDLAPAKVEPAVPAIDINSLSLPEEIRAPTPGVAVPEEEDSL